MTAPAGPKPVIIFDVDGTLLHGESYDWAAFAAALQAAAGFDFRPGFFDDITEVTATAIVTAALAERGITGPAVAPILDAVRHGYTERLQSDVCRVPDAFTVTVGASDLLPTLTAQGYTCAIATGDWFDSIRVKLDSTALPWRHLPIATSSDRPSRTEIITLAAERAGRPVQDAIYVGDGVWDHRATVQLGIPFIGVGTKLDRLHTAGATHLLPDLSPAAFFAQIVSLRPAT